MNQLSITTRPKSFDDVFGISYIVKDLKKRSFDQSFPQVLFFEGNTGTGKSSLAFILAALVNCHNPIKNEDCLNPCGQCPSCLDIWNFRFSRNTMYLKANQDSGKEGTEKLNKFIRSTGIYDKHKKVVIVDEAQNLTKGARAELLTLLEKPQDTIFILCTMDSSKFDTAILGRGVRYRFKAFESTKISEFIFKILKEKNLLKEFPPQFIKEGIFTIAENCNGSLREALNIVERCLQSQIFTKEEIINELGLISEASLIPLIVKLLTKDKSFFKELFKTDIESFFYKSYSVFARALIYINTGVCQYSWQEKNYRAFKTKKNEIKKLLEGYDKFHSFKKMAYLSLLAQFFEETVKRRRVID